MNEFVMLDTAVRALSCLCLSVEIMPHRVPALDRSKHR